MMKLPILLCAEKTRASFVYRIEMKTQAVLNLTCTEVYALVLDKWRSKM